MESVYDSNITSQDVYQGDISQCEGDAMDAIQLLQSHTAMDIPGTSQAPPAMDIPNTSRAPPAMDIPSKSRAPPVMDVPSTSTGLTPIIIQGNNIILNTINPSHNI
uniref:Uncharacterized protein LOC114341081 n=1 Tax=Diabrotica virgifera virgifera TaxID=50390 RepID=A0A6P7GR07_DIAVI